MIRRLSSVSCSFGKSFPLVAYAASVTGIRPLFANTSIPTTDPTGQVHHGVSSDLHDRIPKNHHFSTVVHPENICLKGHSSYDTLLSKLENALEHHRVAEAWETFTDFKKFHGFPSNILLKKLIIQLSYSSDPSWLRKGYDLVLLIFKKKSDLLHYDFLAKLSLSLARTQMPVPASTVLRVMLQLRKFPPMDLWKIVFLHMVKTKIGTYLASDILVDICDCFLHHMEEHGAKNTKHLKLIKPDTMICNLVLDACVRFQLTLKAEQIVELMPVVGIVADATTIVVIAQIHEMNGQRDELKKLRDHVVGVPAQLFRHYRQFYDCLLSLHFKFNDLDAAAELILDMYRCNRSCLYSSGLIQKNRKGPQKPRLLTIGSCNLRTKLRLQIEPELLQKDFVHSAEDRPEMVIFKDGKIVPSNKALAKLMAGYRRDGKVGELSKLLVAITGLSGDSLSLDVLGACVQLGWLETAHDILDDMESARIHMDCTAYLLLLKAYCKENMLKEAKVLLRQMKKAGLLVTFSDEEIMSKCLLEEGCLVSVDRKSAPLVQNSSLAESLIAELKDDKSVPSLVYEINSSIYFFCKGNMMEDAMKTYRRMQERGIEPTVQTFANLVNGYSSLKMFREITILWGDIRRRMDSGHLTADRDLHEMLVWNFIHGGYFERVMEVLEYMKRHDMYTDKWKYKREFLKLHKNLYRSLKAEEAKTEAQVKRLEHVRAFRKWVSTE